MRASLRAVALATVLLLVTLQFGSAQVQINGKFRWTKVAPASGPAPSARSSACMGWVQSDTGQGHLVVFGGSTASGATNETWIFALGTSTWSLYYPQGPVPDARFSAACAAYATPQGDDMLIVAHGTRKGHSVLDDIWSWTEKGGWQQLPNEGDKPAGRYGPGSGMYPGEHHFIMTHGFAKHRFSNTYSYDMRTKRWTEVYEGTNEYNPWAPHSRCLAGGTVVRHQSDNNTKTHFALYGGCLQNGFTGGPCPARDSWTLDMELKNDTTAGLTVTTPHSPKWRKMQDGPSPRARPVLTRMPSQWGLPSEMVLLIGGEEKGKQTIVVDRAGAADLDLLHTAEGKWYQAFAVPEETNASLPVFRSAAAVAVDDQNGRIFIYGGTLQHGHRADTDELWMLEFERADNLTQPIQSLPNYGLQKRAHATTWLYYIHLHGLLMFLAFGVLFPLGIMVARHLKNHDPLWFYLHRAIQFLGVCVAIGGLVVVVLGGARNPLFAHGMIGLVVLLLVLLQPINAFVRPHKGATFRKVWEKIHKYSGRLALIGGFTNISLGIFLIISPWWVVWTWTGILGGWLVTILLLDILLCIRKGIQRREFAAVAAGKEPPLVAGGHGEPAVPMSDVESSGYSGAKVTLRPAGKSKEGYHPY